jgi:hypothetical protein
MGSFKNTGIYRTGREWDRTGEVMGEKTGSREQCRSKKCPGNAEKMGNECGTGSV